MDTKALKKRVIDRMWTENPQDELEVQGREALVDFVARKVKVDHLDEDEAVRLLSQKTWDLVLHLYTSGVGVRPY